MKIKLFFFFFLSVFLGISQQKHFDIVWQGTTAMKTAISKKEVSSFNSDHFNYDDIEGLTFFAQWEESTLIDEKSVQLTNVSYQNISKTELKGISVENLPISPKVILRNIRNRNKRSVYFEVSPIINDNGLNLNSTICSPFSILIHLKIQLAFNIGVGLPSIYALQPG